MTRIHIVALAVVLALISRFAGAQNCASSWSAFRPDISMTGSVNAVEWWDPDGPSGPRPQVVVIAGQFTLAASEVVARNICTFNPTDGTWDSLNGGVNAAVNALAIDRNGHLVVGGGFSLAGTTPVNNVAVWSGIEWKSLGSGVNSDVRAITVLSNGDTVVAGIFGVAGGKNSPRLARWNGSAWFPVENPINLDVLAVKALPSGGFVAAGNFNTFANGQALTRIAQWNGSEWLAMGSGFNDTVYSVEVLPNGNVVAAGAFTASGSSFMNRVAIWNGTLWNAMPHNLHLEPVREVRLQPGGELTMPADFSIGGGSRRVRVYQWDGSAWIQGSIPIVETASAPWPLVRTTLKVPAGTLFAGGSFPGKQPVLEVTSSAVAFPSRLSFAGVRAIAVDKDGMVISGAFVSNVGTASTIVARSAPSGLKPAAPGLTAGTVSQLETLSDGRIAAVGEFTLNAAPRTVAILQNGSWNDISSGIVGRANCVAELADGSLMVGGLFTKTGSPEIKNLAIWNGSQWRAPEGGSPNAEVFALARDRNGVVFVGGSFTAVGAVQSVAAARWFGTHWQPASLPGSSNTVYCMVLDPDGTIVVGGAFYSPPIRCIARWNGTSWQDVSGGAISSNNVATIFDMACLPDGQLIVGGRFDRIGGVPINNLAQWTRTTWVPVGGGGANGVIDVVHRLPNRDVVVAGSFTQLGTASIAGTALWTDQAIYITTYPFDTTSCGGRTVQLFAGSDGRPPLQYRWQIEDPTATPSGWRDIDDGPVMLKGKFLANAANTKSGDKPLTLTQVRGTTPVRIRFLVYNPCNARLSNVVTIRRNAPDLNCDGVYNDRDFSLFASAYDLLACDDPAMPSGCPADLNADGVVDDQDFGEFVVAYNAVIPE